MIRQLEEAEWAEIALSFSSDCVHFVQEKLERDGLVEFTVEELGGVGTCAPEEARALLERLTGLSALETLRTFACGHCAESLSTDLASAEACLYCGEALREPAGLVETITYRRQAEPGRSAPWVLVLHGMNSRGAWQEELSWLMSSTYGRSVPVFIYKYGVVRPGVLLRNRQRVLTRRLAATFKRLAGERGASRLGPRPDVLAHSFGTWLLGHVLLKNEELSVGRVILMGSLLRPDFSWNVLIQRRQVEAVMNHFGGRDRWTPVAHFLIPDSGPSGAGGFNPGLPIIEHREPSFGHTSFFRPANLQQAYSSVWKPFLQRPLVRLPELAVNPSPRVWNQAPWLLRATLPRMLLLAAGASVVALLAASLLLGLSQIAELVAQIR